MINRLAVVVAAYNEELNISKCLDALLLQTYQDFLIVVVDDGSIDRTAEIVKSYTRSHANIFYVYQNNSGAAEARKRGVEFFDVEYVTFVDADDLLSDDAIESALEVMSSTQANVVLYQLVVSRSKFNNDYWEFVYYTDEVVFKGRDAFVNSILHWGVHGLGVFERSIFIKSYLDYSSLNYSNINYINNDEIVTRLIFLNSKNVAVCSGKYFYQFNENSVTKNPNERFYLILENTILLHKICIERNIDFPFHKKYYEDFMFVYKKYKTWKSMLHNLAVWKNELNKYLNFLFNPSIFFNLSLKEKLKLIRIKFKLIFF